VTTIGHLQVAGEGDMQTYTGSEGNREKEGKKNMNLKVNNSGD